MRMGNGARIKKRLPGTCQLPLMTLAAATGLLPYRSCRVVGPLRPNAVDRMSVCCPDTTPATWIEGLERDGPEDPDPRVRAERHED